MTVITSEYVLDELPISLDLTSRQIKRWAQGGTFNSSQFVLLDGHRYACKATHTAMMVTRPGVGSGWATYWDRVLWPNSRYVIGSVEYVTSDSESPGATSLGGDVTGISGTDAATATDDAPSVDIVGGEGGATSGSGASVNLIGGIASTDGSGGTASVYGGANNGTGDGGPANIGGGKGGTTSGNGGKVQLYGGDADGDGNGGDVILSKGFGAGVGIDGHYKIISLPSFADDAAAAAGSIPVHGLYRTGSVIKVRVS